MEYPSGMVPVLRTGTGTPYWASSPRGRLGMMIDGATYDRIVFLLGLIIVPTVVYILAKRDFKNGTRQIANEILEKAEKKAKQKLPEIVDEARVKAEDAIKRAMAQLDERLDGAFDSLDDRVDKFMQSETFQNLGEDIGQQIGSALANVLSQRAAQSRGGQSRGKTRGWHVEDVLNMIPAPGGQATLGELIAVAQEHPQLAAQYLQERLGGQGNGGSQPSYGQGVKW